MLKYAKGKDSNEVVSLLKEEGIAQANRYADTEVVRRNVWLTTLHKIVVVYRVMEMRNNGVSFRMEIYLEFDYICELNSPMFFQYRNASIPILNWF